MMQATKLFTSITLSIKTVLHKSQIIRKTAKSLTCLTKPEPISWGQETEALYTAAKSDEKVVLCETHI